MRLMMFYEYVDSGRGGYECMDIEKDDDPGKAVDDFVRKLRGWKNARRLSVKEDPHMPEPSFVALYIKNGADAEGTKNPRLEVGFHVRDEKKASNTREAFGAFVDLVLKDKPKRGRKLIKEAVTSPKVNNFEAEYLVAFLLRNLQTHKDRPKQ